MRRLDSTRFHNALALVTGKDISVKINEEELKKALLKDVGEFAYKEIMKGVTSAMSFRNDLDTYIEKKCDWFDKFCPGFKWYMWNYLEKNNQDVKIRSFKEITEVK